MFKIIALVLVFVGILIMTLVNLISKKNNNKPKKKNNNHNFCILIPARDESKVIEGLLNSIKNQTYKINMNDVYVVVESSKDKTIDICKKYGACSFVRKKLNLKTKGYALDEVVKYILSCNKKYDAYFIFDADNILDKDYLKNMLPVFDKGYDLAAGYRNCKNGNSSVVASASILTFSLVNTLFNNKKCKKTKNITFSGTGFYIRGYIIEKLKGFPFNSLTEDYELSLYATSNDLTTYYNEKSIFYDEQPLKYKDTINQRIRWIRGYFSVKTKYTKILFNKLDKNNYNNASKIDEIFGIIPFIFIILGLIIWPLDYIFSLVYNILFNNRILISSLYKLLIYLLVIYFILMFITFVIIMKEKNKLNLNLKSKIKVLFYNPIFMISYIPCAIKALTLKEVKWTRVEHGKKS